MENALVPSGSRSPPDTATAPAPPPGSRTPGGLPVLSGRGIDRSADRTITIAGVALAAAFLLGALITSLVPGLAGGPWLSLHLALAGTASVAIAALMPFFAATLVATRPAPSAGRVTSIGLIATGAVLVTLGVHGGDLRVGTIGGCLYIGGMAVLLTLIVRLLRGSLGARRRIFTIIYGAALLSVLAGATLSTSMLAGVPAVLAAWPQLRAAHAWLNLFGFVGLVVAATLIHLFPTVVGARIGQGRPEMAGIGALAAGPLMVAIGFMTGAWLLLAIGGVLVILGAVALTAYGIDVLHRRATWTTDPGWHRFTTGSLTASIAWLAVAEVAAAVVAVAHGPGPAGWLGAPVIAALVLGAIVQVIVGSWTHLLPAIGPGSPVQHAWQRRLLGRNSGARLGAFNVGVIVLIVAATSGTSGPPVTFGTILVAMSLLGSLVLFGIALTGPRRQESAAGAPRTSK